MTERPEFAVGTKVFVQRHYNQRPVEGVVSRQTQRDILVKVVNYEYRFNKKYGVESRTLRKAERHATISCWLPDNPEYLKVVEHWRRADREFAVRDALQRAHRTLLYSDLKTARDVLEDFIHSLEES